MDIFHQEKIGLNPLRGFFSPYTRNIHPMFATLRYPICMFSTFFWFFQSPTASGVLLKMEVGIRRGAWQRAWRYPAYLWSLRWVYAVKKTWRLVYAVYPHIPPNTPLPTAETPAWILTLKTSNDAVLHKEVPFEGYKSEILYSTEFQEKFGKITIVSKGKSVNCHNSGCI